MFETEAYVNPADQGYPSQASWQGLWQAICGNNINSWLAASGFRSFLGVCSNMIDSGAHLQSSSDGSLGTRINYIMSQLHGKIVSCIGPDEYPLPMPRPGNGGVIGGALGPTQVVVSGGTATVTWPDLVLPKGVPCRHRELHKRVPQCHGGQREQCEHDHVRDRVRQRDIQTEWGTVTETGLTILVFNELCGSPGQC